MSKASGTSSAFTPPSLVRMPVLLTLLLAVLRKENWGCTTLPGNGGAGLVLMPVVVDAPSKATGSGQVDLLACAAARFAVCVERRCICELVT